MQVRKQRPVACFLSPVSWEHAWTKRQFDQLQGMRVDVSFNSLLANFTVHHTRATGIRTVSLNVSPEKVVVCLVTVHVRNHGPLC